jgi:DNA-binding CsgD family transcriptional regulator/tetratricopeptide (TPR) repeat protein
VLRGRRDETAVLDRLLESVRGGESRVLVVHGEAGVGKSALLDYVAGEASGVRVVRAAGVQSEIEFAFAGLHQLVAPMLDDVERLPAPQRDALLTAFGLARGAAPNRFLVGLAVLGLLSNKAIDEPMLCLVDDAQWLDQASAQALAFVARRLVAEPIALIFAVRDRGDEHELAGLPQLVVHGLDNDDARALLASAIKWPVDERVRDRIVAETHGNPLALLELPRGLTPTELAGGFGLPGGASLPNRIEDSFQRRVAPLPTATRRLLLLAAAEPLGDLLLLWRAAERLGIKVDAADAAESEGLVEICTQVTFRHPLVRTAIYRSASADERREVHRALAEATDPQLDPDRRAWHFAQAVAGPDEDVAAELERSADRAQARGGLAAAAAFLERSAALTLEPGPRARRVLAAARATAQSGAFDVALRLLATAEAGPLDELQHAQAELLRGQIAFASSRGSEAPPLLLKAAKRFEPLDVELARQTYLEALSAAQYAGRFAGRGGAMPEVAKAARACRPASPPPSAPDLLLDGLALLNTQGYAAASPALQRALLAFASEDTSTEHALRWLWLVIPAAQIRWDDESWRKLSTRHVRLARDAGALGVLPMALGQCAGLHLFEGDFAAAASLIEEAGAIADATGSQLPPYAPLALAAFRGRDLEASELVKVSTIEMVRRGEGVGLTFIHFVTALLYNGLGRYPDALAAAQQTGDDPHERLFSMWAAVELIEGAARSGHREQAADALERLSEATRASGSDWALGVEACARALLSEGAGAERLYREAIDRLARTRIRMSLARAHLVFGEWLRRDCRRIDAREQLRIAHEMFVTMGAEGFAERTRRELLATGETARTRAAGAGSQLTAQEAQVAELARQGLSNSEIGARLFISPRTVEYHLHKVFRKLGVNSRARLHRVLPINPSVT